MAKWLRSRERSRDQEEDVKTEARGQDARVPEWCQRPGTGRQGVREETGGSKVGRRGEGEK